MGDVYWVGQDGNIYFKGEGGITNRGSATTGQFNTTDTGLVDKYADYAGQPGSVIGATRIADPALQGAPTAPTGGGAARPALNTGAVQNTQLALDQLPALLQAALATEGTRYGNTINELSNQEKSQRGTYDQSTTTNQQNYDQAYMDSVRSGSKGLGSLLNVLRGTGAGGSSTEDQVRDIVGGVTANDIRTGADTQKENQVGLDSALSGFLTELERKKRVNEDTRVNNERAITRDNQTQMQDLLGKMAGYYGDAGRTAERDSFMSRAGALTPGIAQNSATQLSSYDSTPIAVQAPQLTAFAAPSQPNVAAAPENGQVGSGIFTISDRRRKEATVPTLAAAGV